MEKSEGRETRYFIDLDLETRKILGWGDDQRVNLIEYQPENPSHHRIFITRGQYNKLKQKFSEKKS